MSIYNDMGLDKVEAPKSQPLNPGRYVCAIDKAEWKTSQRTGVKYISLEWTVIVGEHKGRKVWQNIFVNSEKSNFSKYMFKTILEVTDRKDSKELDDLVNGEATLVLGVNAGDDNFGPSNEVKRVEPATKPQAPAPKAATGASWKEEKLQEDTPF